MAVSRTFRMVMHEGAWVPRQPAQYRDYLARIGDGEERDLTIKAARQQGTQSMRYLRGVVIPDVAAACGYSDPDDYQEVFEACAWKFLRLSDHPQLGTPRRQSTAKHSMSQEEMTAFIDKIILWAESSIPGCRIRRPNEIDEADIPDYGWAA